MLSLSDLTTPLTTAQVKQSIYNVLGAVGVNTTSWKSGAVVRTMISGCAIAIAGMSSLSAQIARSGFLELAEGPWLTLVARYVFGEERIEATFAAGEVTLTNTSGFVYTLDPDDLIVANSATEKTYRNSSTFTLNPGASLTVPVIATEAGSASTATPGSITTMVTTLTGVTCTNATAVVGRDEESDPLLRTRCLEKLGALSPNGPWDAYAYFSRTAQRADGSTIGVTRVRVTRDGFGHVDTYVATATGGVTGDVNDPSTDLGAIDLAIQKNAAPLAVTARTHSAVPLTIPVAYTAWLYNTSGKTPAQIAQAIADKLAAFFSTQPIGGNLITPPGKIYVDAIRTVIGSALPEIFHVVVSAPAADVDLAITEVPVLGAITVTALNQVAPPDGGL